MKKLFLVALGAVALAAFVGSDVIGSTVGHLRTSVRQALTARVPLSNQLAEAQAQVDAYAESIIRGEVASENLRDMIGGVEREVRALRVRSEHERTALASLRSTLQAQGAVVPTALGPEDGPDQQHALRRVRTFQATQALLERRRSDLERLKGEYAATVTSLTKARSEQVRLGEEVHVLAAELESLRARKAAARTRDAVGDRTIAGSGFAEAKKRIQNIRSAVREQNKLLQYYEYERVVRVDPLAEANEVPGDALSAIDEALATYPAK